MKGLTVDMNEAVQQIAVEMLEYNQAVELDTADGWQRYLCRRVLVQFTQFLLTRGDVSTRVFQAEQGRVAFMGGHENGGVTFKLVDTDRAEELERDGMAAEEIYHMLPPLAGTRYMRVTVSLHDA